MYVERGREKRKRMMTTWMNVRIYMEKRRREMKMEKLRSLAYSDRREWEEYRDIQTLHHFLSQIFHVGRLLLFHLLDCLTLHITAVVTFIYFFLFFSSLYWLIFNVCLWWAPPQYLSALFLTSSKLEVSCARYIHTKREKSERLDKLISFIKFPD